MELKEAIAHLDDILHNKEWDCEECKAEHIQLREYLAELQEYRKAILNNTLIKLPCKVGDTVYGLARWCDGSHGDCDKANQCTECPDYELEIDELSFVLTMLEQIGETVFLTREEAEKALKERESDNG